MNAGASGCAILVRGAAVLLPLPTLTSVRVVVDGVALPSSDGWQAVEPGEHHVHVEGPGWRSSTVRLDLRPGERRELRLGWTTRAKAAGAICAVLYAGFTYAAKRAPDLLERAGDFGGLALVLAIIFSGLAVCVGNTRTLTPTR